MKNSIRKKPGLPGVMKDIIRLSRKGISDPRTRDLALEITEDMTARDNMGFPDRRNFQAMAQRIYRYVREQIGYTRDPHFVERLADVPTIHAEKSGDCDDMSIIAASLLGSLGVPVRFVTLATNPARPSDYTHIYVEYKANGEWRPFDATIDASAGELPGDTVYMQRKIWTISGNTKVIPPAEMQTATGESNSDLAGCGCGSDGNLGAWGMIAAGIPQAMDVISGGPKQRARAARREESASENYLEAAKIRQEQYMWLGGLTVAAGLTGLLVYKLA